MEGQGDEHTQGQGGGGTSCRCQRRKRARRDRSGGPCSGSWPSPKPNETPPQGSSTWGARAPPGQGGLLRAEWVWKRVAGSEKRLERTGEHGCVCKLTR